MKLGPRHFRRRYRHPAIVSSGRAPSSLAITGKRALKLLPFREKSCTPRLAFRPHIGCHISSPAFVRSCIQHVSFMPKPSLPERLPADLVVTRLSTMRWRTLDHFEFTEKV